MLNRGLMPATVRTHTDRKQPEWEASTSKTVLEKKVNLFKAIAFLTNFTIYLIRR